MDFVKFDALNGVKHYVNPIKIIRVTYTPPITTTIGEGTVVDPETIVVHLDNDFAFQLDEPINDVINRLDVIG